MLIINNYEEFASHLGQVLGTSEWLEVPQERINLFADATLDHQWIHVDAEKAKSGPFGQTIVHGYLTLSLLPHLWNEIIEVRNLKMMVNYGMDKMKFGQPRALWSANPPHCYACFYRRPSWGVQS